MNSSQLRGFLTGLIYGDGSIDNGVTKRAFRIKSIYPDFLPYVKNELESCTNFKININTYPERVSNDCTHKAYSELVIKSHPYFSKKYHHFYDDFKNRVASNESLGWLNDVGLALWYMSDGYMCLVGKKNGHIRDRRVDICTDRYSERTVDRMITMLESRFGLQCTKSKRGNSFRIRIKSTSYRRFYDIVSPYIVSSMRHKLYFGYEKKPEWMTDSMWNEQCRLASAMTLAA